MVVTLASDCTSITISSDLVDQYITDLPDPGILRLIVTHNCGTPVEIDFEEADITLGSPNTISIPLADLEMTDVFTNGVYRFKLAYIGDLTSVEYYNQYVACEVECALVNHYAEFKDSSAYAYHQILQRIGACDEYTYENACELWDELKYLVDNSDESNCGCD